MNKSHTSEMSEKEIDQIWQAVLERVDGPHYEPHLNGRITRFWPPVEKALAAVLLVGIGVFGWLWFGPRDRVHQVESRESVTTTRSITIAKSETPISTSPDSDNLQNSVHQVRGSIDRITSTPIEQNQSEKQITDPLASETALSVLDNELTLPSDDAVETASISSDVSESTLPHRAIQARVAERPTMMRSMAIEQQKISLNVPVEDPLTQPKSAYEKLGIPPPWEADTVIDSDVLEKFMDRQERHDYKIEYEYYAKSQPRRSMQKLGIHF